MNELTENSKSVFGFWVYLMTDCVLFASLFATYAVLHVNTFDGPPGAQLFHLPNALAETLILLTSSFTCGLATISIHRQNKKGVIFWFIVTFILGIAFLSIELNEFSGLIASGNSWTRSGFLTSFFALVGTHGLHITIGLLWMVVMMAQVLWKGLTEGVSRRLLLLSMFWHFLDIIWIFIFTIVYLFAFVHI